MSYKFKVGDKGKTRNGLDYEVLVVDEGLRPHEQVIVTVAAADGTRFVSTRCIDGKYHEGTASNSDLIPPKRKVWRITMRYANPVNSSLGWTQDYDNGSRAGNVFASLGRTKKPGDVLTMQEVEIDYD